MSDMEASVGNATINDGQRSVVSLQDVAELNQAERVQASSFSQLAERALATAVQRPNTQDPSENMRQELVDPSKGAVGIEKSGIVTGADMPADPSGTSSTNDVSPQQAIEGRVMDLYVDLTNYQIAWKIAQRMQQDISQLLRGS